MRGTSAARAALLFLAASGAARAQGVRQDDYRVRRGGPLEIEADWIADADGDGVVQIALDDVVVDFGGALLRGCAPETPPDQYQGIGVLVTGRRVTVRNLRVAGFRVGLLARGADGLVVEEADLSDGFRQRLRSGPLHEDAADWLMPHENDAGQWAQRYGAGIWIEDCRDVTVRGSRARDLQNGLCLARVRGARVYDNDFSFLSGWGVALWRTEDSIISRNALDFCVRGYQHGVYNRGQDSAGLLMFEQCSGNLIAENSLTHGGDGLFGFAGRAALGEARPQSGDHHRLGCNDNLIIANDLSYAAAHGLELTFSFGNRVVANRMVGNAICGVWGGYSRDLLVAGNTLAENGQAGYGLERGGIDVEHAAGLRVLSNRFRDNACGVHLWWDPDPDLAKLPWARDNGTECRDNDVVGNDFDGDQVAVQLRSAQATRLANNAYAGVEQILLAEDSELGRDEADAHWVRPVYQALGQTRPVGARDELGGREAILMTEWGPWDHRRPVAVRAPEEDEWQCWRLLGVDAVRSEAADGDVEVEVRPDRSVAVRPRQAGALAPYRLTLETDQGPLFVQGVARSFRWSVCAFPWRVDPRQDDSPWQGDPPEGSVRFATRALALAFGSGGPGDLPELAGQAAPGPDHFGLVANTEVLLPAGAWTLRFRSDDGIRVRVDGALVHDDWTWHAPRDGEVHLKLDLPRRVAIRIEHFELDGNAELSAWLERRQP